MESNFGAERQEIYSWYVLKAIAAFLVVSCHSPSSWLGQYPIVDLAVPIFFMITGYFLYRREGVLSWSKVKSLMLSTAKVLIPLSILSQVVDPTLSLESISFPILIRVLFVSVPCRIGNPLWFLTSIFWGILAFYLLQRFFKERWWYILFLLIPIGLFMGKYRFLISGQESSYYTFNFLVYAIPCLSSGLLTHKYQDALLRCRYIVDALLVVSVLFGVESYMLHKYGGGLSSIGPCLFLFPTAMLILLLSLKVSNLGQGSFMEKIGRDV